MAESAYLETEILVAVTAVTFQGQPQIARESLTGFSDFACRYGTLKNKDKCRRLFDHVENHGMLLHSCCEVPFRFRHATSADIAFAF